mgnify:CR=1 FL=1
MSALSLNESITPTNAYSSGYGGAVKFGLGFDYAPTSLDGIGFRIAYEGDYFAVDSSDNAPEFKDIYSQSLNLLYFGVQYKF